MKFKHLLLLPLLTFLSVSLFSTTARADHFAAGDLYITYIGAGIDGCTGTAEYKYEITVDLYKACDHNPNNPATLPPSIQVNYSSATATAAGLAGASGSFTLNLVEQDTLDQLCDTFKSQNSCRTLTTTAPIGFDHVKLTSGPVTLPYAQPDWVFSFGSCCTSNNLINVPSYIGYYIECMLNNQVKYNNSTPRFMISPLPYICVNQPTTFLNGPFDVNNDSLRTRNTQHYIDATNLAVFLPGYSIQDPVQSSGANPYRIDTFTGAATFTPTLQGRYTLDFQCDEFDRKTGVLTGYIRRTCEVNVLACNEPPPAIDTRPVTIDNGTLVNDQIITCPGNTVTFKISGKATLPTSKVYLEASTSTIPGSAFTVTNAGTSSPEGVFTWTPTTSDYGLHSIIITSKDSTCNNIGSLIVQKNYTVIKIKVVKGLDAGPDQPICVLNPSPKQLFAKGGEDLTQLVWQDISGGPAKFLDADNIINPIANPNITTTYVVSSPQLVGTCKSRDTVVLFEDRTNTIDIFPQTDKFVMCRPDYLQLDAMVTGKGPLNNIPCGISKVPAGPSDEKAVIYGSPIYGSGFSYDTVGAATPIFHADVLSAKTEFLITKQELKEYGLLSSTLKAIGFETVRNTLPAGFEYSNFTISLKCTNKTTLSSSVGFETGMVAVYTATGPTLFPDGIQNFVFDTPYDLDSNKNLIVQICYGNNPVASGPCSPATGEPPLLKFMPTTYASALELKAQNTTSPAVCATVNSSRIIEKNARPVFTFDFVDAPALPFRYIWSPGQYLSDSTIQQPLAYAPNTTRYTIKTSGKAGCLVADTIEVYIPVHDFSVLPKDTAICFGEGAPLNVLKGTYYQWYEFENGEYKPAVKSLSCDNCANPVASPEKTTHYKIMVGDDVFCYDTIDAYVEVRPLPNVNILTPDTTIKYGQSVQLLVNGARLYNWSPVSSLNNPNVSYPIATPTEPTMYVVTGLGTNGCRAFDTVRVNIDYRDKLFIPTAFSPNGDGKNDNFRIPNLTFQRIVEFRVFNRWGQEIFSGGDPKKGWDGTWKGVSQEIGTYQYMIRVAYPDGYVETYKGDVALVK